MSLAWVIVLSVAALASVAEWMHARRLRRLGRLAFGPTGAPRPWVAVVPPLRVLAAVLLAWGLWQLQTLAPRSHRPSQMPEGGFRHLLLVLDVSPSMQLKDAGPDGQQTRMRRAHDLLMSVFQRVALDQVRISVIAFYTGAKPVVIDTYDLEVVRNILNDLPLDQAFDIGKTRLLDGLRLAAEVARPWQPGSTALILVSDGDTVPDTGMPEMPRSIGQALVVGVGDTRAGKFIDGHQSRQDASTLRQVAHRLGGRYHDANVRHLPSDHLSMLARVVPLAEAQDAGWREAALTAVGLGAGVLLGLPLVLALWGSHWQPARRSGKMSDSRGDSIPASPVAGPPSTAPRP